MPGTSADGPSDAAALSSDALKEHVPFQRRGKNIYVPMDDDNNQSDDELDDSVDKIDNDATISKNCEIQDGSSLNITISRPNFSTPGLQTRYGYQPVDRQSLLEFTGRKIKTCRCGLDSLKGFLFYIFPALVWLPEYDLRENAVGDLMAGLIVGIVNIPQSMAFCLLAELPPVYGLYTAFFAPLAFFLMGSSRHTSVGTFGVISILAGNAVEKLLAQKYPSTTLEPTATSLPNTSREAVTSLVQNVTSYTWNITTPAPCGLVCEERLQMHMALCLLVGLIQMLMAVFRMGFVTVYLAHPLVRAFTTGAACHVITSQVPPLLGLSLPRYAGTFSLVYTWRDIFINIPKTNVATLIIGLIAFVILAPGKYVSQRYKTRIKVPIPWELIVVIVTVLISYFVKVEEKYGVDIIADIPLGFPAPTIPSVSYFGDLIGDAISIAVVGFAISVSLAKIFASKNDYEIESNQELLGYGASNVTSSFFSCFVSASALGRVAILDGTGSKTQVAMIVSSFIVMLVLLVLGPLFEPLPKSVLSVIISYALRGIMAQFADLGILYKTSKIDCSIWLVTWFAVFLLGVDIGLGIGVVYALLTVIVRTQLPHFSSEGRLNGSEFYKDVKQYKSVETDPEIHIFKMEASLYYANAEQFKRALYRQTGINPVERLAERRKLKYGIEADEVSEIDQLDPNVKMKEVALLENRLRTIIIDCSYFGFVDLVGAKTLVSLSKDFQRIGMTTLFASCTDSVMRSINIMGQMADNAAFFPSVHDAVINISRKQQIQEGAQQQHKEQEKSFEMLKIDPELDGCTTELLEGHTKESEI